MTAITIRTLDDDLKAKLRVVDASLRRSMEEAKLIIRQALTLSPLELLSQNEGQPDSGVHPV